MNTCTNCGNEITGAGFQYGHGEVCKPCEDRFRDEQAARFREDELVETYPDERGLPLGDELEAHSEELDPAYMGGLDSDLLGEW